MADTKEKIEKRLSAQCTINRSRKLTIWDSRTFKPIINHDDLERIMATLGFVAVPYFPPTLPAGGSSTPATATITDRVVVTEATWKEAMYPPAAKSTAAAPVTTWKEYIYSAECRFVADSPLPPRPRLPYPKIDGLHVSLYTAFLGFVKFYIRMGLDLSSIFHVRGIPLDPVDDQNKVWLKIGRSDSADTVYCHGTLDQELYESFNSWRARMDENNKNDTSDDCKMVLLKDITPHVADEHDSPPP